MLLELTIRNIALIESLRIEFAQGFNVLTGETGAGKSIIIDSINFLLGNKSAKNLIRTGSQYAFVSAVFCDFSNEQKQILEENGVFVDEDGNIIVSRRITSEGRSYSKINDVAVTVTTLKNIANVLVNIHGQHDGAKILDSSSHLGYLDAYCDNYTLIDQYQAKYNHVKAIRNELLNLNDIKNNN
jgi:DNA repair protein RecN (Recombination protein N)